MSMPSLILPARPLSLRKDSLSTPNAYFWSTPIILALTIFLLIWQAPGVYRDFQISQNPLPLEQGDVRDGRCTTRKAIFTDCEARLVYTYGGKSYDQDVRIMFVDFHVGDYETGLVISADHPELATMSLGLDKLWNRIITLAAFAVFMLGLSLGMIFLGLRIARAKSRLSQPARLMPVPVEIMAFDRRRGRLSITYADKIASGKTGRTVYTRLQSGEEPLLVGINGKNPVVLAVRHGDTSLPILLDSRLQRINGLTEEERVAALAPFQNEHDAGQDTVLEAQKPEGQISIWSRIKIAVAILLMLVIGVFGFWLWYVTSSPTQFQSPGMDINNLMPRPLNAWGCSQLKARFGHDRAPFGCVASDYKSWK